jgi:acetyl esterase/lipase
MLRSRTSRPLVDPELLDFLDELPTVEITTANLAEWRNLLRDKIPLPSTAGAADAAVRVSTHLIKGQDSAHDVLLRVYQPGQSVAGPMGAIFHIHGGGYMGGESAKVEPLHRMMAIDLGCVVTSVDYRLAPETSFPGNIEDCYVALAWLFGHTVELNLNPQKIGVMGESAGGGLAAALALLARDRGEFAPAFQHLIYPMLDDRTCVAQEPHPLTGEFVWTTQNNAFGWTSLLGAQPGSENVSPYAAAARAENLMGLPPTFICTAALDLFFEEDIEYARRLTRAGVPVELHAYPGAFHGFDLHPTAQVARAARRDSRDALARFLRTS